MERSRGLKDAHRDETDALKTIINDLEASNAELEKKVKTKDSAIKLKAELGDIRNMKEELANEMQGAMSGFTTDLQSLISLVATCLIVRSSSK